MGKATLLKENEARETISVETDRFGVIDVVADKIITMTSPFLGFPESRRFVLRPHKGNSPFMWLQSLDNPALAFVVVQPAVIDQAYRPAIPSAVHQELGMRDKGNIELLVILTIPKGKPMEMTANLLGPVAINAKKRLARQVLLDPARYNPCTRVFP